LGLNARGLLTDLGCPSSPLPRSPVADRHDPVFENARLYSEVEELDVALIASIDNREAAFGASRKHEMAAP
jgi:hypothetical protein